MEAAVVTNAESYAKLEPMDDLWGLSDYDLGMLARPTSDGSCARLLGRSEVWVREQRVRLAHSEPIPAPQGTPPTPDPAIIEPRVAETLDEALRSSRSPIDRAEVVRLYGLGYGVREVGGAVGCSGSYVMVILDEEEVPRRPRTTVRPRELAPLPVVERRSTHGRREGSPCGRKLSPSGMRAEIPAKTLRFARWFRAARWTPATIAWLFDLDPDALKVALATGERK